ncbi:neuronatin [Cricetulus griseus]
MQLSAVGKAPAALTRGQAVPRPPLQATLDRRAGPGAGLGRAHSSISKQKQQQHYRVTGLSLRVGPGSLTAGVQVLPAEAGAHGVQDRAAGAGGAQAASPQLRPQIPALGGRVIRCSCASRPAWEPVPRRNEGSPVLSRQRSTCQGQ